MVRVYSNHLSLIVSYVVLDSYFIFSVFPYPTSYRLSLDLTTLGELATISLCSLVTLYLIYDWWKYPDQKFQGAAYWLSKVKLEVDFAKGYQEKKRSRLYRCILLLCHGIDEKEVDTVFSKMKQSLVYASSISQMIFEFLSKKRVFSSDYEDLHDHMDIPKSESKSWLKDHVQEALTVMNLILVVLTVILVVIEYYRMSS